MFSTWPDVHIDFKMANVVDVALLGIMVSFNLKVNNEISLYSLRNIDQFSPFGLTLQSRAHLDALIENP